jgi:hypothetical protein
VVQLIIADGQGSRGARLATYGIGNKNSNEQTRINR